MRRRSRKHLKRNFILMAAIVMIPFLLGGAYVGGAMFIINDITSFVYTKHYNSSDFIPANFTQLARWADAVENRFEKYHIPANISLTCTYKDANYTDVYRYHHTDNVGLATGFALATECFRYRAAVNEGNVTLAQNASRCIKRLLTGFSYLLAVPNGGIGPAYPGSISRFYWSPNDTNIPGYWDVTDWINNQNNNRSNSYDEAVRHFNGTGAYQNWRWRGSTSKDEMAGYLFGLGAAVQYCQDDPWIFNRAGLLVAQIIEGFKKTDWLVINGDGHPCGSDMKMVIGGGEWILSLLQIGKAAFANNCYGYHNLYHYFATKNMYMNNLARGSVFNVISQYYGWNFMHKTLFNLITLENDPRLKNLYVRSYVDGVYSLIGNSRSPYFNMMYLVFTGGNDSVTRANIFDQLMRFENNTFCRNLNSTPRPAWHQLNQKMEFWSDFIENNPLGMIYSPLTLEINFDRMYLQPASIDMMYSNVGNFYESNPHSVFTANHSSRTGLAEGPGNTFTCVYWMGRAYGIIPPA